LVLRLFSIVRYACAHTQDTQRRGNLTSVVVLLRLCHENTCAFKVMQGEPQRCNQLRSSVSAHVSNAGASVLWPYQAML
jgi:hypothetical protein